MPGSALPRVTRLFLAGNGVAMTGNGLVIAFTLIYLHQACDSATGYPTRSCRHNAQRRKPPSRSTQPRV